MIPLLHIITLFEFLFCLFAVRKLYYSYKKTKNESINNFLRAFGALGVYFGIVSLPGLVVNNPFWVQVIYTLSYPPLFFASIFLLLVVFNILNLRFFPLITIFVVLMMVINTMLNITFFDKAWIPNSIGPFYYWAEGTPLLVQIINGISILILTLINSLFFWIEGWKVEKGLMRTRSFFIASGLSFLISAAISNYIVSVYLASSFLGPIFAILAGLLALIGLSAMLFGIYYKSWPKSPPLGP